MQVAWVHFGVTKVISHVVAIWYFVYNFEYFDTTMIVLFIVFTVAVIPAQVYGTYAEYCIALKMRKKAYPLRKRTSDGSRGEILVLGGDCDGIKVFGEAKYEGSGDSFRKEKEIKGLEEVIEV